MHNASINIKNITIMNVIMTNPVLLGLPIKITLKPKSNMNKKPLTYCLRMNLCKPKQPKIIATPAYFNFFVNKYSVL